MPAFAYRGRDARGGLVTGRLDGADSSAVADQLLAIGVTPWTSRPRARAPASRRPMVAAARRAPRSPTRR